VTHSSERAGDANMQSDIVNTASRVFIELPPWTAAARWLL